MKLCIPAKTVEACLEQKQSRLVVRYVLIATARLKMIDMETLIMAYAGVGTNGQWRLAETTSENLPQSDIFQYRPLAAVDLLLVESELATRKVVDTRNHD